MSAAGLVALERLKSDQEQSKRRQDSPLSGQERLKKDKSGPRRPKSDPERPKSAPKGILEASWLVLGRVWEAKTVVFFRFYNIFCKTNILR